jgi:two-component system, NarL family, sensor kinase
MSTGDPGWEQPRQGLDDVLRAMDDERRDLADRLHDGPQQLLTAMRLVADGTLHAFEQGDGERVRTGIERLEELAAEGAAGLQRMSACLHPGQLEPRGLAEALDVLVASLREGDIEASLTVDCDWPPGCGERDSAFYQVARECSLESARRGATRISIRLAAPAGGATLGIRSAGCGGLGEGVLLLARRRAAAVGARLEVEPGEPVVVELTAPA